jgi:hypothetical protein
MLIEHEKRKVMQKLQEMPENEMTKKIIIPLLESLGYHKVEFFGGTSEEGKDILCWELDKLGDLKLIVAQVKHFKFTNKASDSKSLQTIINQLIVCFKKQLMFTDQSLHLPSEAYLITSHVVDSKSLHTRFGHHPDLRDQKIKIIDGLKLATLILKHTPAIVKDLIGGEIEITTAFKDSLNNEILLKALGYTKKKDIKNIYTDIDFSLGKVTTQIFFNASFTPTTTSLAIEENDWIYFKSICDQAKKEFSLKFLNKEFTKVEEEYKQNLTKSGAWKIELNALKIKLRELKEVINTNTERRNDLLNKEKKEKNYKHKIENLNKELVNWKKEHNELADKISKFKKEDSAYYKIDVNGILIASLIEKKRKWIEDKVTKFNLDKPTIPEIRVFIDKCKEIINTVSLFFANPNYFSCIGYDVNKVIRKDFESTRFKLPIEHIFDTGLNIAVLGEAGAGKSTSLQMYALNSEMNMNKLLICVALANVTQIWSKTDPDLPDEQKIKKLDEGLAKYLAFKGIQISPYEFSLQLSVRQTVLLLDGIDEAIKLNSWLPAGINFLSNKYKNNVQIVVTSRMSGSYLDEIPFFAVTLLPFTDEQRNLFIDRWFEKGDKRIVKKIKDHLERNKSISEIIKNPLLTTTLCVLAKNDIDLPNTEIKLYNDRLKLLTGYYDRVKNIESRIISTPQNLELMAQKLAFYLHSEGKREEDKNILLDMAVQLTLNTLSIDDAKTALNELIDPCNILVPMTDDGKFGFGHLRYQEHLVAKEISSNRSIEVVWLLKQGWWREPLILFAKMNTDLQWLITLVGERTGISSFLETLNEMILTRPEKEKIRLLGLVNSYIKIEKMESSDLEEEDEY